MHQLRYVKGTSTTSIAEGANTGLTGWWDASYEKAHRTKAHLAVYFKLDGGAVA